MELTEKLEEFQPRYRQDQWTCSISGDETYYVNVLREKIDRAKEKPEEVIIELV